MFAYLVKTHWLLKAIFPPGLVWNMPVDTAEPTVYLTFDDGPHPVVTPFILEQLEKYQAKATFFCLGKNVEQYPDIYRQTLNSGHATGNHTYNHRNGWNTANEDYFANIAQAAEQIDSSLFRPPYGKIRRSQAHYLQTQHPAWKICMWDILSADFDTSVTPELCLQNVLKYLQPGAIVIFHDSEKAWPRMKYALPRVMEYCQEKGWKMKSLSF